MDVLAGTDFFTVEVLTWRGLVTYSVSIFHSSGQPEGLPRWHHGVSAVLERKIAVSPVLLAVCEAISGNTSHFTTFRERELRIAIRPQ